MTRTSRPVAASSSTSRIAGGRRGGVSPATRPGPRRPAGGGARRQVRVKRVPVPGELSTAMRAARLPHDAVHRGQTQSRAAAGGLRREERVEDARQVDRRRCRRRRPRPSARRSRRAAARRAVRGVSVLDAAHASTRRPEVDRPGAGRRGRWPPGSARPARSAPGSARTHSGRSPTSMSVVTPSPTSRRSMGDRSASASARSMVCGRRTCLRLKASSWPTRSAARRPAFRISAALDCWSGRSPRSAISSSACPMIATSRLLKSWAMPLDSRPSASILCACRSSASRRRRSVRSRHTTCSIGPIRHRYRRQQDLDREHLAVGALVIPLETVAAALERRWPSSRWPSRRNGGRRAGIRVTVPRGGSAAVRRACGSAASRRWPGCSRRRCRLR